MKNSKLPWRKAPGNRPSHFQCADNYNIGSVNSGGSTEGESNLNLIIQAVNEHDALAAVAEAADRFEKAAAAMTHHHDFLPGEKQRNYHAAYISLGLANRALAELRSKQPISPKA